MVDVFMPTIAQNKKGLHDHFVIEQFDAGIALSGPEVKSIRAGRINMQGSYISVDKSNELWLVGCHVGPYSPAATIQKNYNPTRSRKLLLTKKEISYLAGKYREKGLTILPISVYTKGGLIKVSIGIVKSKKERDKRQIIKKRQTDREIRHELKRK